jgi:hypothetical protein
VKWPAKTKPNSYATVAAPVGGQACGVHSSISTRSSAWVRWPKPPGRSSRACRPCRNRRRDPDHPVYRRRQLRLHRFWPASRRVFIAPTAYAAPRTRRPHSDPNGNHSPHCGADLSVSDLALPVCWLPLSEATRDMFHETKVTSLFALPRTWRPCPSSSGSAQGPIRFPAAPPMQNVLHLRRCCARRRAPA